MEDINVEVLITNYNHEDYILECLKSVQNQTYSNWKAYIIDDCSNDDSVKKIKDFIKTDDRFVLYENKRNIGKSRSLNILLQKRAGSLYTAFLDSDDTWCSDKLQKQIAVFDKNANVDAVHSNGHILDERNSPDKAWGELKRSKLFSEIHRIPNSREGVLYKELLVGNFIFYSSLIFRSKSMENITFNNLISRSMDWLFLLEIAQKTEFAYIDAPLANYRIHGNNLQNKVRNTLFKTIPRKYVISRYFNDIDSDVLSKHYYSMAREELQCKPILSKRSILIHIHSGLLYDFNLLTYIKHMGYFFKKIIL